MRTTTNQLRRKSLRYRKLLLEAICQAGAGHTGGSLSCVDILTVLYGAVLNVSPARMQDPDRDRYVQSKGHSVEALYATLAGEGFFPESELRTLCRYQSQLIGHPTRKTLGIEHNTGALGHGLSFACGVALAGRLDERSYRVYTLLGDGELAEGSNWEGAMFASHHRLDRLAAIVDCNRLQITGPTSEVMSVEPLSERWAAFGWEVREADGHDHGALAELLDSIPWTPGKPNLLVARTIKGKGVSFMENQIGWHHKVPSEKERAAALEELAAAEAELEETPA